MRLKRRLATILFIAAGVVSCGRSTQHLDTDSGNDDHMTLTPKVIYGDDDRLDLYQVKDEALLSMADSTVALIQSFKLTEDGDRTYIRTRNFGSSNKLCASEPFREQETAAFCSGFLVRDNIIVTAGHCIQSQTECEGTSLVFGFAIKNSGEQPVDVSSSQVYSCKKLIKSTVKLNGADFAVVELDRPVLDHAPLRLRHSGIIAKDHPVTVIGHPSGLPTKVAGGASVRAIKSEHFIANLDTFGGNSGSAVFNAVTGEVEGVLVRGEVDFEYKGNCRVSKRCSDSECRGEDVTKIGMILDYLPSSEDSVIYESKPNLLIPDIDTKGVTVEIDANQAPLGRQVFVGVDISHTWRGDLLVKLVAPNNKEYVLSKFEGRYEDNINGVYGVNLEAHDDLSGLSALTTPGTWKLKVSDHAGWDTGTLHSWSLKFQ